MFDSWVGSSSFIQTVEITDVFDVMIYDVYCEISLDPGQSKQSIYISITALH